MLNFMHTESLGYTKNQHDRQSRLEISVTKTTIAVEYTNTMCVTLPEPLGFVLEFTTPVRMTEGRR